MVVGSVHGDVPKYTGRVWHRMEHWHSGCTIAVLLISFMVVLGNFREVCFGHGVSEVHHLIY